MKLIDTLNNQLKGKRIFVYRYELKFQPTLPKQLQKTIIHYYINTDNEDTHQLPKWEVINFKKVEVTVNSVDGYFEDYEGNHIHINFNSLEDEEYIMYVQVNQEIEVIK